MRAYRSSTLSQKINRIVASQEVKNFDTGGTITTVAGTATITPLSSIAQGDTSNSRDGRKVMYKAIQGRYHVATTTNTYWRVMVLYDSQPNAATPTATEILESPGDPLSPLSLTWSKRFKVLHDNTNGYGQDTASHPGTGAQMTATCKWYKKLDMPAEYGAVAAPTTGGLALLTLGTAVIALNHYHRVRFTDS